MATRAEIRELARQRADGENDESFVTDTEMNSWFELARRDLHALLVANDMLPSYEFASFTGDAMNADGYTALVDTAFAVLGVYREVNKRWLPLERLDPKVMVHASDTGTPTHYQFDKKKGLLLWKIPTAATSNFRYRFAPKLEDIVTDEQEIDFVNGWEEYLVIWLAIKYKIKEDVERNDLERDLNAMRARVEEEASLRDLTEGAVIRDVYSPELIQTDPASQWHFRPVRFWYD